MRIYRYQLIARDNLTGAEAIVEEGMDIIKCVTKAFVNIGLGVNGFSMYDKIEV